MSKYQAIIGRFEHVDLIEGLHTIPAKIDTGAHRSSIHVQKIEVITKKKKPTLRFTLLGHPVYKETLTLETQKFRSMPVRSSNGHISERYEVQLKIRLGLKVFNTSFTLSDRSGNVFPVLIGRKALRGRFFVDADRVGVNRAELRKAIKKLPIDEEDIDEMEGVNV
jgi:hypothetical protein